MRRAALGGLAVLLSCGGTQERSRTAPAPAASASAAPFARCPATLDVREVLARHARAYGAPDAIASSLPITMTGTLSLEGHAGKIERVVAAKASRTYAFIGGIVTATGIDAVGPWSIEGGSGVAVHLTALEAIGPALDDWLLRRTYVAAFDAARDTARCADVADASARVDVTFARPDLGSPVLAFDLESGALLSVSHTEADGARVRTTFEAWTEASHGVRWPRKSTDHPLASAAASQDYGSVVHGLECARFDATGVAIPEHGAACSAPPPDRFTLRWPAGDDPRVRLPLTYLGGELLVRVKIGGREAFAFLDSGANATAVDATTPAGAELRPSMEITGAGATQRLRLGFGELSTVDLGELHAQHVPTVSVPIPALDVYGDKRPELILGYGFFATAVVRVDYKRQEVVFGKSKDGLLAKGVDVRAVPLRVLKSKIVVDGSVEGTPAPFEVDTGNSGGLDLYKKWASAHGLPGTRQVVTMKGRFGAGTDETAATFYRLAKGTLGPIAFDNHLSNVSDPPGAELIAGLAGNEVLARCDAVVFDVPKRTLWLEGACDRPVPESRAGWRFEKKPDPTIPDRPWVIAKLWPGGAAELAGVRIGDRVLEVAGKPATLDVAPIWAAEQQPAGSKMPVVLVRPEAKNQRLRLIVELRPLTP